MECKCWIVFFEMVIVSRRAPIGQIGCLLAAIIIERSNLDQGVSVTQAKIPIGIKVNCGTVYVYSYVDVITVFIDALFMFKAFILNQRFEEYRCKTIVWSMYPWRSVTFCSMYLAIWVFNQYLILNSTDCVNSKTFGGMV